MSVFLFRHFDPPTGLGYAVRRGGSFDGFRIFPVEPGLLGQRPPSPGGGDNEAFHHFLRGHD